MYLDLVLYSELLLENALPEENKNKHDIAQLVIDKFEFVWQEGELQYGDHKALRLQNTKTILEYKLPCLCNQHC